MPSMKRAHTSCASQPQAGGWSASGQAWRGGPGGHRRGRAQRTSSTGTLKAASSLCSVAGASDDEQERMKRSGGGAAAG